MYKHSIILQRQVRNSLGKHGLQWQEGYEAQWYCKHVKTNESVQKLAYSDESQSLDTDEI